MKKAFVKYTASISLLLACVVLPPIITWCCGPTLYADEARFALFRNGLDGKTGLAPFYYSENLFSVTDADYQKLDYKQNCREWVAYTNNEVRERDVYTIQYMTSPASFINASDNNNWKEFSNNSFITWLLKPGNRSALSYMLLAKEAESTQFEKNDPWDTTIASKGRVIDSIAHRAAHTIKPGLSSFLKERFAFQAIKMYYYSGRSGDKFNPNLGRLYNQYLEHGKSMVAAWANVYYAMVQEDHRKKTLYLLKAFDQSEEKKKFSFQYIDVRDLDALEKATSDNKTLALVNTMRALKNKGRALSEIKAVVKYNPNSKYLRLLITREVNKLENWIWSPQILGFYDNHRPEEDAVDASTPGTLAKAEAKDKKYLNDFTTYIESIVNNSGNEKVCRQLALAHLYNIGQRYQKVNDLLQQIPEQTNKFYETQRHIELVITAANYEDVADASTQQKIASSIKKLISLNPIFMRQMDRKKYDNWQHEGDNEQNDDLSELYVLLSRCFQKKGDVVTAGLLYTKANVTVNSYDGWEDSTTTNYKNIAYFDRYAAPKDMDALLIFKRSTSKTPFQQLIIPFRWAPDDMYRDLKGTMLFRQKRYSEALVVFNQMNKNFWQDNYEYKYYLPYTSVTHTGTMIPSEKSVAAPYSVASKKLIVQEMVNLLKAIRSAKNDATKASLYYKLGNAYFNTTYNGKAWMMMSYGKSRGEEDNRDRGNYKWAQYHFYPHNQVYKADYYRCSTAIEAYKRSLALTTDKELAAKCLLALTVCDNITHGDGQQPYHKKPFISPYLLRFKQNYSNTIAYKYAAVECPDVKRYLKN